MNLGVSPGTFRGLFPDAAIDPDVLDYTALNQFLPHPDYWKQSFLCILNPAGENVARLQDLIREAHGVSKARYDRRAPQ